MHSYYIIGICFSLFIGGMANIKLANSTSEMKELFEKQSSQIQSIQQRITELENREIEVKVNLSINGEQVTETKHNPPAVKSTF